MFGLYIIQKELGIWTNEECGTSSRDLQIMCDFLCIQLPIGSAGDSLCDNKKV